MSRTGSQEVKGAAKVTMVTSVRYPTSYLVRILESFGLKKKNNNIAHVESFGEFVCVFEFVVVFVIVFVLVFLFFYDFWIANVLNFQNMYGYAGLWSLWAVLLIIFEVMTHITTIHILHFHLETQPILPDGLSENGEGKGTNMKIRYGLAFSRKEGIIR